MTTRQAPKPPEKREDFREAFMKSLVEKRDELKTALDRLMNSRREYDGQLTAGDFIDEVDDAQREISAYGHYSLIERKNKELQKIEYLIGRVIKEEEAFGLCEECGLPIPRERLMIVPEATFCVACQRELEKLDQRKAMAAKASSGLGSPTRREVSFEPTESPEDDDNLTVSTLGALPSVDLEETEPEAPPEEKEKKEKRRTDQGIRHREIPCEGMAYLFCVRVRTEGKRVRSVWGMIFAALKRFMNSWLTFSSM
jgi:DnaK suppressor protein